MTKNFSLDSYLWKRGILLSAAVTLLGFIVVLGISSYRDREHNDAGMTSVGSGAAQFAPAARQDLEAAYHRSWLALRDNFAEQGKLTEWRRWDEKHRGQIRTEKQLILAIEDLLSSLGDERTTIMTAKDLLAFEQAASGKVVGIGVGLNDYQVRNVFPNSPAAQAGLKDGAVILAVDGVPVGGLNTEQMIDMIRGPENTPVLLTVQQDNKISDLTVIRAVVKQDPAIRSNTYPVYSIRVDNLRSDSVVAEIDKALKSGDPLLLDLRGLKGGSGITAAQVAALFLQDGVITGAIQRKDGVDYKLTYAVQDGALVLTTEGPGGTTADTTIETPVGRHSAKLVVLVDDETTGAAEIITAALKENNRAQVVGIKTHGKGTGQVTVPLTKKHVLRITSTKYFSPSGSPLEGNGVTPDLPVDPKERGTLYHTASTALKGE